MDNKKPSSKPVITEDTDEELAEYKSVKYLQKHVKVVMDTNAFPRGMEPQNWAESMDNGVILYDSLLGEKPSLYIISGEEAVSLPEIVDVKGSEVSIKELQTRYEEAEYWNKELYKCRKSPVYYFTNYWSSQKKPLQVDIDAYKESIGYTNEKSQDELSIILDTHSAAITLEVLKQLRPVRDTLDAEYDIETSELLLKASKRLRFNVKSEASSRAKIVANFKKQPIAKLPPEFAPYVLRDGKNLDEALLKATDLDVLVRMYYLLSVK